MTGAGVGRDGEAPEPEPAAAEPEPAAAEPEPAAPEPAAPEPDDRGARAWRLVDAALLGLALVAGLAVRAVLLPTEGFRGDIDQFVLWVHGLAIAPFGRAYDQDLTFGPVMVDLWGLLAALEPAFRTATDAADPAIRAVMKVPASLADVGLALAVAWALRARPAWAVGAGAAILLHPAVFDVSAWWGQYESIFVLLALLAALAAGAGRRDLAAALVAASLMTKPQALPFLVPFGAWFLATGGWRGAARAAAVGLATSALLWLPFLADGGPVAYLANLGDYHNDRFAILSIRAWNPWWLLQEAVAGGQFVADTTSVVGAVTWRHLGYAAAAALELAIFLAVLRRPTRPVLALGLAASTLVAFGALTTMHERYAYATLVFLPLALPDRRVLAVWLGFGLVFLLNLVWAIPPADVYRRLVTDQAWLGWLGPVAMTALAAAVVWLLVKASRRAAAIGPGG